jgi:hypothetical protein
MTALSGPIVFNNSSGDDSLASGCGPSPAITISMMISSGSTSTSSAMWTGTISAGDIVYFNTTTGRKFNVVASANNNVGFQSITFDETWGDNINGNAYCGGKRSTLDNSDSRRLLSTDVEAEQWNVEIEYTGTDYALTSKLNLTGRKTITGTGSSRPSISIASFSGTAIEVVNGYTNTAITHDYHFKFLDFSASADRVYGVTAPPFSMTAGTAFCFDDCSFNNGSGDFEVTFETVVALSFRTCTFTGSLASVYKSGGDGNLSALGCNVTGGTNGFLMLNGGTANIIGCTFDSISTTAVSQRGGCVVNNIFYDCGNGVVTGHGNTSRGTNSVVYGNIFDSCITGISGYSSIGVTGNNFNGNTANTNLTDSDTGTDPINLSYSLMTDPANDDFTLDADGSTQSVSFKPLGDSSSSGAAPALVSRPLRSFDDTTPSSGGIIPVSLNGGMNG